MAMMEEAIISTPPMMSPEADETSWVGETVELALCDGRKIAGQFLSFDGVSRAIAFREYH